MSKTLTLTGPNNGGNVVANQATYFTATVASLATDAAVSLIGLAIAEITESDAQIGQPTFLTPNTSPGVTGNPVLIPGGSLPFIFPVVFTGPISPGQSPNNAPGGSVPGQPAQTPDAYFTLQAQAQFSDGTVLSTSLTVFVLSAVAPFPVPQGGAAQFNQGANSNLVAIGVG